MLGVLGLTTVLSGYSCQTINNERMVEGVKDTVSSEIMQMKDELQADLLKEIKKNKERMNLKWKVLLM